MITPLYTVLLCLPAGLALIIAVCGLAVLWAPPTGVTPLHTCPQEE